MRARSSPLQATIVKPEQVLTIKPFGLDANVLLTTKATGGATSVLMAWHKPGECPPDHVHFNEEEVFFIVEGTYELTVGGQTSTVGPGTIVSSRAMWCTASGTSARRRRACSTAACRVDRTIISKQSPISPPTTASPAKRRWR
jgi:quercetin dioxygenase-like cupin family protein